MGKSLNKNTLTILLGIIGVLVVAGLLVLFLKPGAAAPAPTATLAAVETKAPPPTATTLPPTATALPSPTATALPSPTPIPPLALTDEGMTVWCYPAGQITAPPNSEGLATAPKDARLSTIKADVVELIIPNYSCNYVFHFNQKAPEGLKMEVYDWLQKQPIFSLPLAPATDDPSAAVLVSTNTYLTAPPVWEYTYRFILRDSSGSELWNKQVHMDKGWRSAICLAGVLPNPKTLRCPLRQDSHPWDAWYGKTPVPNDDEHPIP